MDNNNTVRSLALIATFKDGYAAGWRFSVPDAFRDALDIRKTTRIIGNQSRSIWTQGSNYYFKVGDVIHDVEQQPLWSTMLESLGCSLQVIAAAPASDSPPIDAKNHATSKAKAGTVKFQLLQPDANRKYLVPAQVYECTQAEFVRLLQSGHLIISRKGQWEIAP